MRAVADKAAAWVEFNKLNCPVVKFKSVVVVNPAIWVLEKLAALRLFSTVVVAVVNCVVVSDLTWEVLSSDN